MTPVVRRTAVVLSQLGQGGAEQQTVALLRALAGTPAAPCLVICLSRDLDPHGPTIVQLGYPLVVLPRRGSFDLLRAVRLAALLRRERIDLVHAVHLLASGYVFFATGMGRRPPMLPTVRGTVVHPSWPKRVTYRRMFARCPQTLVNSHRGADFIVRNFAAPRDRVLIVPNGIDFSVLRSRATASSVRKELGIPEEAPLVGYAGKDAPVKNVPRCVAVVSRLLDAEPRLHALFAGVGLDENGRARLAPQLPRGRVHFLGRRLDLPRVLADLDLLLLTSDSEGSPNVVLEALGVGTPVVSADVGDVAAMIPPRGGRVVAPAAVDEYVAAARAVLADRAGGRAAVRAAWPSLEGRFSLDAMVSATLRAWDSLQPAPASKVVIGSSTA